tara:strand:+ start:125 stop:586 length:462 start_codon:yes stop_codon:yes gene_type:complete
MYNNKKKIKILIISSCGGHLTEILDLKNSYINYDYLFCINKKISLSKYLAGKTIFIKHSERDLWSLFNFFEAFKILILHKPKILISTGAGPALIFAIVNKLINKSKFIYIETLASINKPSLTGRLIYHLVDHFIIRWKNLYKFFPKATLIERF